jgi:hypothetical protein
MTHRLSAHNLLSLFAFVVATLCYNLGYIALYVPGLSIVVLRLCDKLYSDYVYLVLLYVLRTFSLHALNSPF